MNQAIKRIETLTYSAEMMRNLMLDLLDLAQMENNTLKINEEFFNLHEIIDNAVNLVRYQADRK